MNVLSGHPPWGAEADAALAEVFLGRGDDAAAADAARSAFEALRASHSEDLSLRVLLSAARALTQGGSDEERELVRGQLAVVASVIAQRTTDEDVRVRWFRGPLGRELSALTGGSHGERTVEKAVSAVPGAELEDEDPRLLWLLIEGRTNREIADELGLEEQVVVRRLAEMYARIGVSSRGEAAVFALREKVV
jgi:DNA-binding NarL/FixJ family response regulator